ncbi:MAG: hypothetical protein ACD_62C00020G0004 [uncultured bacterium]|nr:MAG: hypothetical protein ACD_62C00020G0004 [uncultured bacterium]HLD45238.1 6-carboxytetrahydropterin synthase [bacterium]
MSEHQKHVDLICSYSFCAAHRLWNEHWTKKKNDQFFGSCAHVHGHQYKIEVLLSGNINKDTGMLINGYDVDAIVKKYLQDECDHKFLNDDVLFFKKHPPTAEWIAVWLFHGLRAKFPKGVTLKKVRVYETPELAVEYGE